MNIERSLGHKRWGRWARDRSLPACGLVAGPEKKQDAAGILAVLAEGCCAAVAVVLDAAEPAGKCGVTGWPAMRGGKLAVFPDVAQAAVVSR